MDYATKDSSIDLPSVVLVILGILLFFLRSTMLDMIALIAVRFVNCRRRYQKADLVMKKLRQAFAVLLDAILGNGLSNSVD